MTEKRISYPFRIDPKIVEGYKKFCKTYGFSIGARLEIAMQNDMYRVKKSMDKK